MFEPGTPVIARLDNGTRINGHIARAKSVTGNGERAQCRVANMYPPHRYVDVPDAAVSTRRDDTRYPFTPEAAAR